MANFSSIVREVYAAHLNLIACGAEIEDLYVVPAVDPDSGEKSVAVSWRGSGDDVKNDGFEFTVCVAPRPADWIAWQAEWTSALRVINKMFPAARDRLVEGTAMRERLVEVLAAVQFKRRQHESTRRNG